MWVRVLLPAYQEQTPMALNLDMIFTVKSNAQRNLRKAVTAGECDAGKFTVANVGGGFRIVPAPRVLVEPVAEEATSPAGWRAPEPQPSIEDEAAYQAEYRAEAESFAVDMPQDGDLDVPEALRLEPIAPQAPATTTPGLARLRAHPDAEAIRDTVVADQQDALGRKARVGVAQENRAIKARKVEKAIAKLDAERIPHPAFRKPRGATPGKAAAAPGGISPEAAKVLKALFHAQAFRDLPAPERIGTWVEYGSINASDAPHGLPVRRVPGFVAGLKRRGLIECREDKPGKYSARVTPAGAALAQEAGR
jgi:hypothetical protein